MQRGQPTRARRTPPGRLFAEAFERGGELVIYDARGRRMGVLRISNGTERRRRRARFFEIVREIWARNRDVSPAVIEEEVSRAVRAVRERAARRRR